MRNDTRQQFNAFTHQVAQLSGVESATATFAVEPTVQQRLETRIQESSECLGQINVIGVDELKGQKVGLGVSGTIAGRTDTSGGAKRQPRNVAGLSNNDYECAKTDFDTAIPYPAAAGPIDAENARFRAAVSAADQRHGDGGAEVPGRATEHEQ